MLAQGPEVERLESALADLLRPASEEEQRSRVHPGVAVSSGTAALYLALRALGVGEGEEVLLPAYVCASVLQAVRYVRAIPRFVDCDPSTFNLDPDDALAKLGKHTKAIIVAHLFGLPADLDPFLQMGPAVIEDCAQTLGADYKGGIVGSFGQATVCSFYATKLLAAGEGGMVLSPSGRLLDEVRALRDCEQAPQREWAFNFKMTDLQAALGRVQLGRLPELLDRRRQLAERYRRRLAGLALELPGEPPDRDHQYYRFVISIGDHRLAPLLDRCERMGLACRRPVGSLPAPVQEKLEELPGCRQAFDHACSIPLYPALSEDEVELVLDRFSAAIGGDDA